MGVFQTLDLGPIPSSRIFVRRGTEINLVVLKLNQSLKIEKNFPLVGRQAEKPTKVPSSKPTIIAYYLSGTCPSKITQEVKGPR